MYFFSWNEQIISAQIDKYSVIKNVSELHRVNDYYLGLLYCGNIFAIWIEQCWNIICLANIWWIGLL